MLRAILNKAWRQHPTKHQLYGHLPPITKSIHVRRTRHAGHCWRSRDELISDVLLWTPTHGRAKSGRPARTYVQQLCEDTGCCPEDQPEAMNDREKWRKRIRDIRATSTTWWWWDWNTSEQLRHFGEWATTMFWVIECNKSSKTLRWYWPASFRPFLQPCKKFVFSHHKYSAYTFLAFIRWLKILSQHYICNVLLTINCLITKKGGEQLFPLQRLSLVNILYSSLFMHFVDKIQIFNF